MPVGIGRAADLPARRLPQYDHRRTPQVVGVPPIVVERLGSTLPCIRRRLPSRGQRQAGGSGSLFVIATTILLAQRKIKGSSRFEKGMIR